MLSNFPPPPETEKIDYSWDQLTLGVTSFNTHTEIVEDFWGIIVSVLDEVRNTKIQSPEEEAWFHLRRTARSNPGQFAPGRIEIMRLKRGFLTQQTQEKIRLLPGKHTDVICAGWRPCNFTGRHDNKFLSFLQKLSVLRGRDKIFHNACLGNISNNDYAKCPDCQKAYRIMMNPKSPWADALEPWFAYMSSTNMEANRTHEYAHWFGHILSGWGDMRGLKL